MAFMIRLDPVQQQPREIFIFAGQSNSDGQGNIAQYPVLPYAAKIKNYQLNGVWVDATEPIGIETGATYGVSVDGAAGAGAARSFANRMYALRAFREYGIVPCGRGGTGQPDWAPNLSTSTLYGAMVARALAAAPAGILKGLIWYQGEAEADTSGEANAWAATFLTMYDALCDDLSIPDLKCIVTELGPDFPGRAYWNTVQAQQQSLDGARSGNIACVSAADLSVISGDEIHLDTAGQVALGIRYADAMAALLA